MKSSPSLAKAAQPSLPAAFGRSFGGSAVATRKLTQLDAAATLEFLKSPPGNHLEALKGDRKGQHSIRINDQWRICFRWTAAGPDDVEIVDNH